MNLVKKIIKVDSGKSIEIVLFLLFRKEQLIVN